MEQLDVCGNCEETSLRPRQTVTKQAQQVGWNAPEDIVEPPWYQLCLQTSRYEAEQWSLVFHRLFYSFRSRPQWLLQKLKVLRQSALGGYAACHGKSLCVKSSLSLVTWTPSLTLFSCIGSSLLTACHFCASFTLSAAIFEPIAGRTPQFYGFISNSIPIVKNHAL